VPPNGREDPAAYGGSQRSQLTPSADRSPSRVARSFRRRALSFDRAEVDRLRHAALVDSLTGLRNRLAFHEDLARDLAWAARTGRPLALSMLDLNGLKTVNDTRGHQAGDDQLTALAHTLVTTFRGSDRAYRLGGDEFAVISAGARRWDAVDACQRLQTVLATQDIGVTAGIAEGAQPEQIDTIIREADLALIAGKRNRQDITLYSPEIEVVTEPSGGARDAEHVNSLSRALALAVDAKDSYTRSHCQTVSQLCALLASELRFAPEHIEQMRLAGLLHDVGKIGIPDAILNKPAALTEAEYDQMKRHSVLGEQIVAAGELPEEARWVRHHHERYDGDGYPDGLAASRRRNPAGIPDYPRRGCLRGDDGRPSLPQGSGPGVRPCRASSSCRHSVRPSCRARAQPRAGLLTRRPGRDRARGYRWGPRCDRTRASGGITRLALSRTAKVGYAVEEATVGSHGLIAARSSAVLTGLGT
jgi:diguanylate cyclase (GGDEF)-like protein/putative nucleotidyltransferase with HDIG domain